MIPPILSHHSLRLSYHVSFALFTLLYTVVGCVILFAGKVVGVADNNDFYRTIDKLGLMQSADGHFTWFNRYYFVFENRLDLSDLTPTMLLLKLLVSVNNLIGSKLFDITWVGVFYLLVTAMLLHLLFYYFYLSCSNYLLTCVSILAVAYVLLSPSYLLFYNSFYQEPTSIVCMVFMVLSFILFNIYKNAGLFLLIASAVVFSLTKIQFVVASLIICMVIFIFYYKMINLKRKVIVILLCFLPVIGLIARINDTDSYYRTMNVINKFNAVYNGILATSGDNTKFLAGLDLPLSSLTLARSMSGNMVQSRWISDDEKLFFSYPERIKRLEDVSRLKIALYYLSDLDSFKAFLTSTNFSMSSSKLPYLGNFEKKSGMPASQYDYSCSWDSIRETFKLIPMFYIVAPLLILVFALLLASDHFLKMLLVYLPAFALSQYGVIVIGDGFFEHSKHLLMAKLALDVSIVFFLAALLEMVYTSRRQAKQQSVHSLDS